MSYGADMDPVLRRLPAATWRALPALAVLGLTTLLAFVGSALTLGLAAPWTPAVVGVVSAPVALWALDSLQGEIFDQAPESGGWLRRLLLVEVLIAVPTALAAWSGFVAEIAETAGSIFFQILAVAAAFASLATALLAVVAIPLANIRRDVGVRAVLIASIIAIGRRPLASTAALLTGAALTWLALTSFTGLFLFVAPLLVILAVAAAWSTVARVGVTLPPLAPLRHLRKRTTQGMA